MLLQLEPTSLLKVAILGLTATLFASTLAPALAPRKPGKGDTVYKGQPFEYVVHTLAWLACFVVVSSSACHAALLALQSLDPAHDSAAASAAIPHLCPSSPPSLRPLAYFTPRVVIGAALVLFGGSIRLWSYHTLGKHFTFEVIMKDDHELITSGPYAYIRHPSYTGVAALLLGAQLMHFGESGYLTVCGIERTPVVVLIVMWRWGTLFSVLSLYRRCSVEDAQLRKQFGSVWESYRERVRYRLMPLVL